MPVDDVAFGRIIRTPQVVEDFVALQQLPGVSGEQVEQVLLQ